MGKRIIISEEEKRHILGKYQLNEDFSGIKDGKIEYVTSSGQKVLYKITHPVSDFDVVEFDINTGKFKLDGNFVAGDHEGVISKDKLKIITDNMEKGLASFDIQVGEKNTTITFKRI